MDWSVKEKTYQKTINNVVWTTESLIQFEKKEILGLIMSEKNNVIIMFNM